MVIRDNIYNDIYIEDEIIVKLISTYEFQRLRKINQLGMTPTIFPSAMHTRFSHSIGVYHLACEAILKLDSMINLTEDEKKAFKIASLLHDVGHGPLSHTAELFFNYSHEDYTIKIILDKNTQINQILTVEHPELIGDIVDLIDKKHLNHVLNSLISSSIDIDRMDYLIRDSYNAGVVYGNFDANRLFKSLDINGGEVVFHEKAINTIEDFLMARYHMFTQVYLNKKTVANESLVKSILSRVKKLLNEGYNFKVNLDKIKPFFEKEISIDHYLKMNDYVFLQMIEDFYFEEEDEVLRDLTTAFVKRKDLSVEKTSDEVYEFQIEEYQKKVYNESILILLENGEVKKLEEISPLVRFIKEDLKIYFPDTTFYLDKN